MQYVKHIRMKTIHGMVPVLYCWVQSYNFFLNIITFSTKKYDKSTIFFRIMHLPKKMSVLYLSNDDRLKTVYCSIFWRKKHIFVLRNCIKTKECQGFSHYQYSRYSACVLLQNRGLYSLQSTVCEAIYSQMPVNLPLSCMNWWRNRYMCRM